MQENVLHIVRDNVNTTMLIITSIPLLLTSAKVSLPPIITLGYTLVVEIMVKKEDNVASLIESR